MCINVAILCLRLFFMYLYKQFFSHVATILPGLSQYLAADKVSCSMTQPSDSTCGEVRTRKVSKGTKIRNIHNWVPHLAQDTNGKVTNSQLDTTNESQEVSHFPAGDHKARINRRAQRHSKHKTEKKTKKHKRSTKEVPPWNGHKKYWRAFTGFTAPTSPIIQMWIKTHRYMVCMKDLNLSMHHLLEHINQDITRR